MSPELGESDGEELPTVHFLRRQCPDVKSGTVQPSQEGEVLVLSSSDSEDSSLASPTCKKPCSRQDSTRAAAGMDRAVELSSDSEDEDVVPLAERLKRRLLDSQPATTSSTSFTRIRELSTQYSAQGNGLHSNDERVATDCRPRLLPKAPATQRRAAPKSWEMSDSDQEAAPWDPKNQPFIQPPVCLSDCPAPSSSCQRAELHPQPFSLPTKTKHSQEELDRARQAALNRRKDQEARKLLQKEEKERKKAAANLWKAQKPGECMKHIQVVLDPGLLQVEGGGQLLTTLQSMECSCAIESHVVPRSIVWRRKTGLAQAEEPTWTEEPNILVLVLLEEFVSMVHSYKQVSKDVPAETLLSFVAHIMKKTPEKTLALVVVGLENYFSSHKHKSQKKQQTATQSGSEALEQGKPRNRRDKANSVPHLSRVDVEEALVALQLYTGIQIRILESWKELGDFASMFTKAVAEAPFKRERDKASFSFCLEGDWTSGMKVDHSGKGLLQVWKKQIQQLNRVSLEMATAIVAKYPSPQLLVQAYSTQSSEQERYNLLAEIPVRRGDGVTATTRRVGPELSKRVYLQMTSHNPDLSLDVTG
ncbi:crossover junction endonuclease EME1 [Tiliqua scincoides]|uniref:crossover junction endonuclease EME1 n=1 Tax=Tiliqua scincoides TaxID=71010 RepID=UPI003462738A